MIWLKLKMVNIWLWISIGIIVIFIFIWWIISSLKNEYSESDSFVGSAINTFLKCCGLRK